jgi:hypothetical protein
VWGEPDPKGAVLLDGQIIDLVADLAVQSFLQKYFCFRSPQIIFRTLAIPSRQEGRFAIVINAGRDAMDAGCFVTTNEVFLRTAKPCGPGTPTLVSSSRDASLVGDGG